MHKPDPRLTPARPDLAARHLAGKVAAERFVDGQLFEVIEPSAPLRRAPASDAALDTEALQGERVTIYETTAEGWCWGQLETDGYVGYLPQNALAAVRQAPTHKVAALRTLDYAWQRVEGAQGSLTWQELAGPTPEPSDHRATRYLTASLDRTRPQ